MNDSILYNSTERNKSWFKTIFLLVYYNCIKKSFPVWVFLSIWFQQHFTPYNKSKLTSIWQKYSFYFAGKLLINHKQIITRGLTSKTSLKIWPQKVSWKWYFTFNSLPPLSMSNVCLTCLHQYGKLCTKSMLSGEKCQSRHNSKHF